MVNQFSDLPSVYYEIAAQTWSKWKKFRLGFLWLFSQIGSPDQHRSDAENLVWRANLIDNLADQ